MALVEFRQTKVGPQGEEGLLVYVASSLHAIVLGDRIGETWHVHYSPTVLDQFKEQLVWTSRRAMKQFFRAYGLLVVNDTDGRSEVMDLIRRVGIAGDEDQ